MPVEPVASNSCTMSVQMHDPVRDKAKARDGEERPKKKRELKFVVESVTLPSGKSRRILSASAYKRGLARAAKTG